MLPQLLYLALTIICLAREDAMHGKDRPPSIYNFWATLAATILVLALLFWGGFFDVLL